MSAPELGGPDLATFAELAQRAGCTVRRCAEADLARASWWTSTLPSLPATDPESAGAFVALAVAQSLGEQFAGADHLLREGGAVCSGDSARLLCCAVGVSDCALAVAETGSLLLAGAEPADRLVWLLPPVSILLVRPRNVAPSLENAMIWLRSHPEVGAATLVTGPSRTSDVERVLTIGVQGPREVRVVLVGE
jgi:hypothetical protein